MLNIVVYLRKVRSALSEFIICHDVIICSTITPCSLRFCTWYFCLKQLVFKKKMSWNRVHKPRKPTESFCTKQEIMQRWFRSCVCAQWLSASCARVCLLACVSVCVRATDSCFSFAVMLASLPSSLPSLPQVSCYALNTLSVFPPQHVATGWDVLMYSAINILSKDTRLSLLPHFCSHTLCSFLVLYLYIDCQAKFYIPCSPVIRFHCTVNV